jgi:hypothetical protein
MRRSQLQEQLTTLYLRLNGFLVSGFIVHGPLGTAIRIMLRWIGAFTNDEIDDLLLRVQHLLSPRETNDALTFRHLLGPRGYQLRAVLFAPDRPTPRKNQVSFAPDPAKYTVCSDRQPPFPANGTSHAIISVLPLL